MGWYHTRARKKSGEQSSKTRAEELEALGAKPEMPPVRSNFYIIDFWLQAGVFQASDMGAAPLSSTELMAWQTGAGVTLTPFEFTTILELSRQYLAAQNQDDQPYQVNPQIDQSLVADKVLAAFNLFTRA